MILTVRERIEITNLFPQHHNIITQVLVEDISKKVTLSQEEAEVIDLERKTIQGIAQLSWNENKAKDAEIEFTKNELQFMKSQVTQYDAEQKITQGMLSICLKLQVASLE